MRICFDMDGTIADLYGVENWLDNLIAENVKPYAEAKPMLNLSALARKLLASVAASHGSRGSGVVGAGSAVVVFRNTGKNIPNVLVM